MLNKELLHVSLGVIRRWEGALRFKAYEAISNTVSEGVLITS